MKRIIVFVFALLVIGTSYAQKQKKPKINAAEKARSKGELGEAKEIIDLASEYEKLKDDGKTWYYKGLIYASLDTTNNPTFQNLANDPLKIAMKSFDKANELGGDKEYFLLTEGQLPITQTMQIDELWRHYLSKGLDYYNVEDGENAYMNFVKTTIVKPKDTIGYLYAGQIAMRQLEDYDLAMKQYNALLNELNYKSKALFQSMITIEGSYRENTEKALAIIKKARKEYPDDSKFARQEINALIKLDRVVDAKSELENAIADDPENSDLLFILGILFEETDEKEKAKEAYLSSIKIDSENINSRYNVAAMLYNEAIAMINISNNLGISKEDEKKASELNLKIDESLKEALPHWEKLNELQPNDKTTLETLQYIYSQEKMYDKAEAIGKQLDSL